LQNKTNLFVMKRSEENIDDKLRALLNSTNIEAAPEHFTSRVMMTLTTEKSLQKNHPVVKSGSRVPIISAVITCVLILLVILLPSGNSASGDIFHLNFLHDAVLSVIKTDPLHLMDTSMPGWVIYIIAGFAVLLILDLILSKLFSRNVEA
jgi:hypothetical protein